MVLNTADGRYGIRLGVQDVTDEDYAPFIFGSSCGVLDDSKINAQFIGDPRTGSLTLCGRL